MATDYTVNAFFLGNLADDPAAGKEGSGVEPAIVTFTDVNDNGIITEETDLLEGILVETFKSESILVLSDGTEVKGWYVEIEVAVDKDVYFIPTDGTIPRVDTLGEDVDLQGAQEAPVTDLTPVPCFTGSSLILTKHGLTAARDLRVGDLVQTRDNGYQEIRWVGLRSLEAATLSSLPQYRPIRIAKDSLGPGVPERDLLLSPNHRVLVQSQSLQLYFGEYEALVAAKHLGNRPGITQMPAAPVSYVHLLFDAHQIVLSDGAWTESFLPGRQALGGFERETQNELYGLFPELREGTGDLDYALARIELRKREMALLD